MIGGALGRASVARPWVGSVGLRRLRPRGDRDRRHRSARRPVADGGRLGPRNDRRHRDVAGCLLRPRASTGRGRSDRPADRTPPCGRALARSFLTWSAGAVAATTVGVAAGRALRGRYGSVTEGIELPAAVKTVPLPGPQPFSVPGLSEYVTPNADFYRIDTALFVPRVSTDGWSVTVHGMVDHPFELSYDELLAMPMVEEPVTIACVSNEVGGDLIGNAVWRGVPLPMLLERAGVQSGATQIVGRSVDDFTVGFPTELALDGRTALVAVGMNGEPLPVEARLPRSPDRGRPVRLRVGDEVAARHRAHAASKTSTPTGCRAAGRRKARSRPSRGSTFPATVHRSASGRVAVAGVAWAPTRGITAVEVQVDDGGWQPRSAWARSRTTTPGCSGSTTGTRRPGITSCRCVPPTAPVRCRPPTAAPLLRTERPVTTPDGDRRLRARSRPDLNAHGGSNEARRLHHVLARRCSRSPASRSASRAVPPNRARQRTADRGDGVAQHVAPHARRTSRARSCSTTSGRTAASTACTPCRT